MNMIPVETPYPYIEHHSFHGIFEPDSRPIEDIMEERRLIGFPEFQTYEEMMEMLKHEK